MNMGQMFERILANEQVIMKSLELNLKIQTRTEQGDAQAMAKLMCDILVHANEQTAKLLMKMEDVQ